MTATPGRNYAIGQAFQFPSQNYAFQNFRVDKNRNTLSRWLYNLHNHINKQLGKNVNITYEEVRDRYEAFRSRCSLQDKKTTTSKKSKEKGCVEPVSGIKTKCILRIVPKNKKCDTIQISKGCQVVRD